MEKDFGAIIEPFFIKCSPAPSSLLLSSHLWLRAAVRLTFRNVCCFVLVSTDSPQPRCRTPLEPSLEKPFRADAQLLHPSFLFWTTFWINPHFARGEINNSGIWEFLCGELEAAFRCLGSKADWKLSQNYSHFDVWSFRHTRNNGVSQKISQAAFLPNSSVVLSPFFTSDTNSRCSSALAETTVSWFPRCVKAGVEQVSRRVKKCGGPRESHSCLFWSFCWMHKLRGGKQEWDEAMQKMSSANPRDLPDIEQILNMVFAWILVQLYLKLSPN